MFELRCSPKIKSIVKFREHFHGHIWGRTRGNGETRGAWTYLQDVLHPSHNRFVVLRIGQKVSPRVLPGERQQVPLGRIICTDNRSDQRHPTAHASRVSFLPWVPTEGYPGTGWLRREDRQQIPKRHSQSTGLLS